jgi:hypothetical protein
MAKRPTDNKPVSTNQFDAASLFASLLAYYKTLAKEARADRRMLRAEKERQLQMKTMTIDLEMAKIDQLKEEAAERFDRAAAAARAELPAVLALHEDATSPLPLTVSVPSEKVGKKSDLIQLQIRHQEDEVEKAATRVAEATDAAEESRRRRDAMRDAIETFLEKVAKIKPQL